jgi:heat shock transcription factor, other eukaryote
MDYLQNDLWRFQQQQSGTEMQIGDIERRIHDMEQRQLKMITFLQKAQSNPRFMENLIKIANGFQSPTVMSVPSSGLPGLLDPPVTDSLHKKRRLPTGEEIDYSPELIDSCTNNNFTSNNNGSLYEDPCSSNSSGRTDFSLINQSFDKLKLGLCPAMAAMSTHSSNEEEDNGPLARIRDTGTSLFTLKSTLLAGDGPSLSNLDLTLASFPSMEIVMDQDSNTTNMSAVYERGEDTNGTDENGIVTQSENKSGTENGPGTSIENRSGTENRIRNEKNVGYQNGSGGLQEEAGEREEPVGPPARVNDVFWEQFLTERPECDSEEASSGLSSNSNPSSLGETREGKEMENLKL